MGRPRKDNSESAVERRRAAGEHFKLLRKLYNRQTGKRFTQDAIAQILGVNISTIRRYESGKQDIPLWVAEKLESATNMVKEFWTGESIISDPQIYLEWMQELDEWETWSASMDEKIAAERLQWKRVFAAIGYEYEDTDAADSEEAGRAYEASHILAGPHSIKKCGSNDPPVILHYDEFYNLIAQLQDAVGYFCYKHSNEDPL